MHITNWSTCSTVTMFSARLSEKNLGASWPPSFHFWSPEQVFWSPKSYFILFPESFQDLLQLEDWTAKLTKLEVLLKLTGKFVYMYNNVLLILSTVTTLTCSQSTILEFPCRRMVQVCHLKNLLCLGTNFLYKLLLFSFLCTRCATETCMCRKL